MNTIGKNFPVKGSSVKITEESGAVRNKSSRSAPVSITVDSENVKRIGEKIKNTNSIILNTFMKNSRDISETILIRDRLKELNRALVTESDATKRAKIVESFLSEQPKIENLDIENISRTIDLYEKHLIRLKNVLQNIDSVAGYGKINIEKLASDTITALKMNNSAAERINREMDTKNILKLLEG